MENTSSDVRPFRIEIPQREVDDLHDRLARTRWPNDLPGTGWERGAPGGHFPAMEVPGLLTGDIRAFFRDLR